jgi:hypothetical protein
VVSSSEVRVFTVVLAGFKILGDAAIGLYRHQSFRHSVSEWGGGTWQGIPTLVLLVFAVLIPFVGFAEIGRIMGEGKLKTPFFQRRPFESDLS